MRPCVVGCLFVVSRRLLAMAASVGGDGDDDVNVQVHFDVADVDIPRADAFLVAFHLDPAADFDVDSASGGNADVDVSVDVDAAPHVDVNAVNDDVAENTNSFGRPEQISPRQKCPET